MVARNNRQPINLVEDFEDSKKNQNPMWSKNDQENHEKTIGLYRIPVVGTNSYHWLLGVLKKTIPHELPKKFRCNDW